MLFRSLFIVSSHLVRVFLNIKGGPSLFFSLCTMALKLISQLNDGSGMSKIVARVQRRWNLYDKASPDEVFCVTMLLVDEKVFCDFPFFSLQINVYK